MAAQRGLRQTALLAVVPGLALAAFIILYPLWRVIIISFSDLSRFGKIRGWAGFDNFGSVFASSEFLACILRSLVWTGSVVAGTMLIALPTAIILARDFYGRGLARVIVMLPWAISLTMTAIIWRWALNGELGLLNHSLTSLGLTEGNIVWLALANTAFPLQIMIGVLVSVPFATTVFLGGLSSIQADLYEAAAIEGASGWRQHMTLTLPLLRPFIKIAVVMNIIYVFNSFPIIWVTTQGGPGGSTDILVTYLYKLAFRFGRMGDAAVVSIVMFALLVGLTWLYLRAIAKHNDEQGQAQA